MQTIKDPCQRTLIEPKMPKEKARGARMTIKRAKAKTPKAKERKGREIRKERKVITRAKVRQRPERQRCGIMLHLWKARTSR